MCAITHRRLAFFPFDPPKQGTSVCLSIHSINLSIHAHASMPVFPAQVGIVIGSLFVLGLLVVIAAVLYERNQ